LSEIVFIFTAGMAGVFLSMGLLYGSIRLTGLAADRLENSKKDKKKDKKQND